MTHGDMGSDTLTNMVAVLLVDLRELLFSNSVLNGLLENKYV